MFYLLVTEAYSKSRVKCWSWCFSPHITCSYWAGKARSSVGFSRSLTPFQQYSGKVSIANIINGFQPLSAQTSFRFLKDNHLPGSSEEETYWKGKCLHFTIFLIVTADFFFRCQVSNSVPGNQITWNLYHPQVHASQSIILGIPGCNDFHFGQVYCTANVILVKLFSCPCSKTTSSSTKISEFVRHEKNLEAELLKGSDSHINIIYCSSLGGC